MIYSSKFRQKFQKLVLLVKRVIRGATGSLWMYHLYIGRRRVLNVDPIYGIVACYGLMVEKCLTCVQICKFSEGNRGISCHTNAT